MSTRLRMHKDGRCTFDTCPFCWEEHEEVSLWGMEEAEGVLGTGPNSAAITDESDDEGSCYDPYEFRDRDYWARLDAYTNADHMEDDVWDDEEAETGHPMRDGGSTYTDD